MQREMQLQSPTPVMVVTEGFAQILASVNIKESVKPAVILVQV